MDYQEDQFYHEQQQQQQQQQFGGQLQREDQDDLLMQQQIYQNNAERGLKRIHHYEINLDKALGKGTFGYVYEGKDTKSGKRIAVKQISLEPYKHHPQMIVPSLKNEVKNMQLLHHQNVVQLYNVFRTENNLYMMVEICDGGNLESFIRDRSKSEEMCLGIMAQILEGFKCLRENNIVHRDLKPQNILIHRGKIKIADFGFSKLVSTDMDQATLLSFVGTPLYMSPQILQRHPYSSKTDIWSLGILFYEMLYGKRPWEGKGIPNQIEMIQKKLLQFPAVPRVSAQLRNLVARMLVEREEERITWDELFSFFTPDSLRQIVNKTSDPFVAQQSQYPTQQHYQQQQQYGVPMQQPQLVSNNSDEKQNGQSSGMMVKTGNGEGGESSELSFTAKSEQGQQFSQNMDEESNNSSNNNTTKQQLVNTNIPPEEQSMNGLLEYFNQNMNYAQHLQMVMFLQNLIKKNRGQNMNDAQMKAIMIDQFYKLHPQQQNQQQNPNNQGYAQDNYGNYNNDQQIHPQKQQQPQQQQEYDQQQYGQQQQQQQEQYQPQKQYQQPADGINRNFVYRPVEVQNFNQHVQPELNKEEEKKPKLSFPTLKFVSPFNLPFLNKSNSGGNNNKTNPQN